MMKNKGHIELITGLDIGSTAIRLAVGQLTITEGTEPQLQIIGAIEVPSVGIQKGNITSIDETVSSVSSALESAEKMVGVPLEHVWVGVSGANILCQDSKGVVAIARTDGEITEEDVARAVEAAKTIASPLNYEILHVLPRSYAVDGQTGVKDPVGMTGIRLEVDTKIIYGLTSHIKNITKTIYRTGVDIDDFVLSIIASGEVIIGSKQKELGTVIVNIGGSTTSMVVYEEGDIIHMAVLPIGSAHITNDLALGLKTSIDIAEKIKIQYGQCISKGVSKKDIIDFSETDSEITEAVSRYYISQIIEARVTEIMEKIDAELQKVKRSGLLPAGVQFIGGGSKIKGLVELAKQELHLPATLGYSIGMQSISDKINDISFVPVIGLVKWGASMYSQGRNKRSSINIGGKIMDKIQKIFKSLVP